MNQTKVSGLIGFMKEIMSCNQQLSNKWCTVDVSSADIWLTAKLDRKGFTIPSTFLSQI